MKSMKKKKDVYTSEADWHEVVTEEAAEFFDGQAEEMLASEFFAEQAADDLLEAQAEPEVVTEMADYVVNKTAVAELAESVVSEDEAAERSYESSAADIEPRAVENWQDNPGAGSILLPGEVADESQADMAGGVKNDSPGLEAMAYDKGLREECEADDEREQNALAQTAAIGESSLPELDYNAIADRVYDMLLRQIRSELAGSGNITD